MKSKERGSEPFRVLLDPTTIRVDPRRMPSAGMPWHNNAGAKNTDHGNTDPRGFVANRMNPDYASEAPTNSRSEHFRSGRFVDNRPSAKSA